MLKLSASISQSVEYMKFNLLDHHDESVLKNCNSIAVFFFANGYILHEKKANYKSMQYRYTKNVVTNIRLAWTYKRDV